MELEKMRRALEEEKKKKMEEEKLSEEMNSRRHPTDSGNGYGGNRMPQSSIKPVTVPQNNFGMAEQPAMSKNYKADTRSEMHNINGT